MNSRLRILSSVLGVVALNPVLAAPPGDLRALLSKEGIAAAFQRLDVDADGKLAGAELASSPWIKRMDINNDGVVTLDEAQSAIGMFTGAQDGPPPALVAPPAYVAAQDSPRQEAKPLKATEHGIGARLPDISFSDLDGKPHTLGGFQAGKPLVIALLSPSCPISKRYGPTLARLEKQYAARGVAFLWVAPVATDSPAQLKELLAAQGLSAPCALDASGSFARALGALSTTDAFVIDAARTLIYRGAIDDQYGLGYSLEAPRHSYLGAAIDAVLAGKRPALAATEAPGCLLDLSAAKPAPVAAVTFHNRISRLLQTNCLECHRNGGVAPFALETYEQVGAKSAMIRKMVDRDLMPPWYAAREVHSPWANDRSLPAGDKADLLAWLEAGKPQGDPKDAPIAHAWSADWQIGEPDAVFQVAEPIAVKESGTMSYQNVGVETGFTEDKWVRGFEVKPSAREVVHHILVFVTEKGASPRKVDGTGGFFAAYVPGSSAVIYPEGFAKALPANSQLVFQIHYTPNGTATHDQPRIGLLFSAQPPAHLVRVTGIASVRLNIPAGADNHPETGSIPVPRQVRLMSFMPHMHVRGKSFRYEVILPNGEVRTLLEVPRYDFNWQLAYRYAQPPLIPAGSKVRATGWFDNSANNPANPDPTKTVRWGLQTTEEMMLGYVEYFFPEGEVMPTAAR